MKHKIKRRNISRTDKHDPPYEGLWYEESWSFSTDDTDFDGPEMRKYAEQNSLDWYLPECEKWAREILEDAGESSDVFEVLEIESGEVWDLKKNVNVAMRGALIKEHS